MYCLSDHIKSKLKRNERELVIEPTYEEYKEFFDEFDKEYEIVDDIPESKECNPFSVEFKVVLEVDKCIL